MYEIHTNIQRQKIENLYLNEKFKFPFISSVASAIQNGRIFANNLLSPSSFFICHDFGWSQLVGADPVFIGNLKKFIFEDEAFSSLKIRAFVPDVIHLKFFSENADPAERCQFRLEKYEPLSSVPSEVQIKKINSENMDRIDRIFGLDFFKRNWPSKSSFSRNSFGFFVTHNQKPVAICYSCASMDNVEEIDVYTLQESRGQGFATIACKAFIQECINLGKVPNWDCFTNNNGSMALARSLGFKEYLDPYPFYTYNRRAAK